MRINRFLFCLLVSGVMLIGVQNICQAAESYSSSSYLRLSSDLTSEATRCSVTIPTLRPMTVSRNLMVENDSDVLYRWNYGEFIDVNVNCSGSSFVSDSPVITPVDNKSQYILELLMSQNNILSGGITTNYPGVILKLYARTTNGSTICSDCVSGDNGYPAIYNGAKYGIASHVSMATGQEAHVLGTSALPETAVSASTINKTIYVQNYLARRKISSSTGYGFISGTQTIQFRAELVKVGDIGTIDKKLQVSGGSITAKVFSNLNESAVIDDLLAGDGISLVTPTCEFSQSNYDVNMGGWDSEGKDTERTGGYQAIYPSVKLNCNGNTNVSIKFTDAGPGPSTAASPRNVTLYDEDNNKVNGLEIKLAKLVGALRTPIDVGGAGADVGAVTLGVNQFLDFVVAYYQKGKVTSHDGKLFVGAVKGKVNMEITYY